MPASRAASMADPSGGRAPPDELLQCNVCYYSFDDASRKPIDLGCGHCYCQACYQASPQSFRRCPECRATSNNPHVSIGLLRLASHLNPSPPGAPPLPSSRPSQLHSSDTRGAPRSRHSTGAGAGARPARALLGPGGLAPALVQGSAQGLEAYHQFRSAASALWRRCLPFMALIYIISPIDLVPDFIPVLGWLDDLAMLFALLYMFWQQLKPE